MDKKIAQLRTLFIVSNVIDYNGPSIGKRAVEQLESNFLFENQLLRLYYVKVQKI